MKNKGKMWQFLVASGTTILTSIHDIFGFLSFSVNFFNLHKSPTGSNKNCSTVTFYRNFVKNVMCWKLILFWCKSYTADFLIFMFIVYAYFSIVIVVMLQLSKHFCVDFPVKSNVVCQIICDWVILLCTECLATKVQFLIKDCLKFRWKPLNYFSWSF